MTDQKEFELSEDEFQKAFDEIKLPFSPTVLLTINLLRCRNVSVNFFQDLIDIPDPQFRVSIPSLPDCGRFVTVTIEDDSPTTEINESFCFVLPKDLNPNDELIIQIELYDRDIIYDDYIGTKTINAAKLNLGESILKTLDFNNHGELDLEVSKMMRSSPDFRYSLGLNPKEKTYRKKRLPHVYNALLETLGNKRGPQTIAETPVVSIVGSGGGYRAATGMSGALEALKDAGLLDVVTYLCGLSGSMWYLSTAYAMEGISSCKQSNFHERLRKRFTKPVMNGLFNPRKIHQFEHYLKHTKLKHQQPYSFTDFFPGYLMGRVLLGKQNMDFKLSNIEPYVRDGDLPLPLFSALHVKSKVEAFRFHVFVESSPFEVAFPELGIGIPPEDFGSLWNQGFLINKRPEIPLHYCQAMHGCAFSILLSSFFERGGEGDELKQCDHVRVNERKSTKRKPPVEIDSDVSEDSDAEREAIRAAKAALKKPVTNNPATSGLSRFVTNIAIPTLTEPREVFRRHAQSSSSSKTNATNSQKERRRSPKRSPIKSLTGSPKGSPKESPKNSPSRNRRPQKKTTEMLTEQAPSETLHTISNKLRSLSLLTNRQALIGRTGRMLNIAKGCNFLKRFSLNPCGQIHLRDYRRQQAVSSLRQRDMHVISTTKDVISIADAAFSCQCGTSVEGWIKISV
ncbi:cytosolic phospholipase A2-like isoform X2 [Clavelina lepadiformis]|uniref:cytosolic phospholipase A2-like isoform X2 n=1 Tax=Clavelina lepadiformis TaxID=159417 RepID=UPI0040425B7C